MIEKALWIFILSVFMDLLPFLQSKCLYKYGFDIGTRIEEIPCSDEPCFAQQVLEHI